MSEKSKVLKFELSPHDLRIRQLINQDFLFVDIQAISDAYPNRNNSHFTVESMHKAVPTFYNKPILGHFDTYKNDFGGHDGRIQYDPELQQEFEDYTDGRSEIPLGLIRQSDKIVIEKKEDGLTWVTVGAALWSHYSYKAVKSLLKSGRKKVSVEIDVLKSHIDDKGIEVIDEFVLLAITIIGVEEGIKGAHLTIPELLSTEAYQKRAQSLNFAYQELDKVMGNSEANIKEDFANTEVEEIPNEAVEEIDMNTNQRGGEKLIETTPENHEIEFEAAVETVEVTTETEEFAAESEASVETEVVIFGVTEEFAIDEALKAVTEEFAAEVTTEAQEAVAESLATETFAVEETTSNETAVEEFAAEEEVVTEERMSEDETNDEIETECNMEAQTECNMEAEDSAEEANMAEGEPCECAEEVCPECGEDPCVCSEEEPVEEMAAEVEEAHDEDYSEEALEEIAEEAHIVFTVGDTSYTAEEFQAEYERVVLAFSDLSEKFNAVSAKLADYEAAQIEAQRTQFATNVCEFVAAEEDLTEENCSNICEQMRSYCMAGEFSCEEDIQAKAERLIADALYVQRKNAKKAAREEFSTDIVKNSTNSYTIEKVDDLTKLKEAINKLKNFN